MSRTFNGRAFIIHTYTSTITLSWMTNHDIARYFQVVITKRETRVQERHTVSNFCTAKYAFKIFTLVKLCAEMLIFCILLLLNTETPKRNDKNIDIVAKSATRELC